MSKNDVYLKHDFLGKDLVKSRYLFIESKTEVWLVRNVRKRERESEGGRERKRACELEE